MELFSNFCLASPHVVFIEQHAGGCKVFAPEHCMFISAFPQVLSCKTANVIPRLEWFLGHTDVSIRIWMLPLLSSYQGVLFSCWESLASVDGRSWTEYRQAQSKKNSGHYLDDYHVSCVPDVARIRAQKTISLVKHWMNSSSSIQVGFCWYIH